MKKLIVTCLFSSLFLLAACGSKKEASDSSNNTSTSKSIQKKTKASTKTTKDFSLSTVSEAEAGEPSVSNSEEISSETSAIDQNQKEQTETSSDPNSNTLNQDQAMQLIKDGQEGMNNPDIVLTFYKMLGEDYLFEASSKSIKQQGGSGTVGFYRVTPQGTVTLTNALGDVS